jgi:hypothetical protein
VSWGRAENPALAPGVLMSVTPGGSRFLFKRQMLLARSSLGSGQIGNAASFGVPHQPRGQGSRRPRPEASHSLRRGRASRRSSHQSKSGNSWKGEPKAMPHVNHSRQASRRRTKQKQSHICTRCGNKCSRLVWAYTSESETSKTKTRVCGRCKKELDKKRARREEAVKLRYDAVGAQIAREQSRRARRALLYGAS